MQAKSSTAMGVDIVIVIAIEIVCCSGCAPGEVEKKR